METKITRDLLVADGWTVNESDPVTICEKVLSDDGELKLVVHRMYNSNQFAVSLPDGGVLNFIPENMEELNKFEKMILSYDSPY